MSSYQPPPGYFKLNYLEMLQANSGHIDDLMPSKVKVWIYGQILASTMCQEFIL